MIKVLNIIKRLDISKLSFLNILLGIMIALTPLNIISDTLEITSSPNEQTSEGLLSILMVAIAFFILFIWLADLWASQYRMNSIYFQRKQSSRRGLSFIPVLAFFRVVASLTMAGIIGTLLGIVFGGFAVFIPILVIVALVMGVYLYSKTGEIKSNPKLQSEKKKNLFADIILLLYAYIIFIVSWQSFVYSGSFEIDLDKSNASFSIVFALVTYIIFYWGACWLWVEEALINLKTRKQKWTFLITILFDLLVVLIKLMD